MLSIYVISEGTPPSREIHAAFSTREAAEAARYLTGMSCKVEEFPVDAPLPTGPEGHSLWAIERMRGNYEVIRMTAFAFKDYEMNLVRPIEDTCDVILWARDEKHALALAKELFEREEAQ